jgi:hypothetical protein
LLLDDPGDRPAISAASQVLDDPGDRPAISAASQVLDDPGDRPAISAASQVLDDPGDRPAISAIIARTHARFFPFCFSPYVFSLLLFSFCFSPQVGLHRVSTILQSHRKRLLLLF